MKKLKLQPETASKIIALGSAPFAMQLASSLLHAIMNRSLYIYGGDIAVSGMGVVMSVMTLIIMPVIGINQGVQPIIGYNYGAQKYDRVKEALKLGIIAATVVVCIGFAFSRLFPEQLISLFNREDDELIAFGSYAISVFMIFLPIVGFQISASGYFQAVGKPKQAMFLSLSRQVLILIPALLILPRFFQLKGVLMAGPLADLISSIITGIWLFMELNYLNQKSRNVCALSES
jgi:Na+-driven multidrug efflux pump